MITISHIQDLRKNLETIENYLAEGTEIETDDAIGLVKRGFCFVAYEINGEIRFAPSRFVGYKDVTLAKHQSSKLYGGDTNKSISQVLESEPIPNKKLEKEYSNYCKILGFQSSERKRKYWKLDLKKDFKANTELDGEFPEGKIYERKHKFRERNSKVVQLAKLNFKEKNGRLFCQVCRFDFEKEFGEIGLDFIEAHHTIPLKDMNADHKTKVEDIAMLCPNCHRMAHKKRPWLKMAELKQLRKKGKE